MKYRVHGNYKVLSTTPQDALADGMICARDAPLLAKLGINTIVSIDFNTFSDHSACMRAFENAGIYVIAIFSLRIDLAYRVDQKVAFSVDYTLYDRFIKLVDGLSIHHNLIGFMMDLNDHRSDWIARLPLSKALIRDVKEYIGRHGRRKFPVGAYGNNPGKSTLIPDIMACGGSQIGADFFAFDLPLDPAVEGLLRCANSSTAYEDLAKQYQDSSFPVLVTYTCPANRSHSFQEVQYIYSEAGAASFAGAIADDWFPNKNEPLPDTGKMVSLKSRCCILIKYRFCGRDWAKRNTKKRILGPF